LYSIRRVISQSPVVRFFGRTGAVGMHFDRRAVQAKTINRHADHVVFLKRIEQPVKNARVGPTTHPGVNRMPLSETWRQRPPFAAILGDKEDGIDCGQVRNPHIPALDWQVGLDQRVLMFCYLIHNRHLA